MIKDNKTLRVLKTENIQPDLLIPLDYINSRTSINYDAVFHIVNPADRLLELGTRATANLYNYDKIKESGITVSKRPYGGTGDIIGRKDVTWSIHINKLSFIDEYNTSGGTAFKFFINIIHQALKSLELDVEIRDTKQHNKKDGVCIHTVGRSEIVNKNGEKLHTGIFSEDILTFSMGGHFLVSDEWAEIYDFINAPVEIKYKSSKLELECPGFNINTIYNKIIKELQNFFIIAEDEVTEDELHMSEKIKFKYNMDI